MTIGIDMRTVEIERGVGIESIRIKIGTVKIATAKRIETRIGIVKIKIATERRGVLVHFPMNIKRKRRIKSPGYLLLGDRSKFFGCGFYGKLVSLII